MPMTPKWFKKSRLTMNSSVTLATSLATFKLANERLVTIDNAKIAPSTGCIKVLDLICKSILMAAKTLALSE